jgi:hypothetical protein
MTSEQSAIQTIIDGLDDAVDSKDWALARSYFADKVHVDFSANGGGDPATIPSDALIATWTKNLYPEKQSFHLRGNHRTTVTDDQAVNESKAYAFNSLADGPLKGIWEIWGFYTYTLALTDQGWKITGMKLVPAITRGDSRIPGYVPA